MLTQERQTCDLDFASVNVLHLINFNHILEAATLQQQLEGRILQVPTIIARNNNVLHFMTNLEKRFEQQMVLMIMGNQNVVDRIGQIKISVTGNAAFIGIAEHRIKKHVD